MPARHRKPIKRSARLGGEARTADARDAPRIFRDAVGLVPVAGTRGKHHVASFNRMKALAIDSRMFELIAA